MAGKGYGMGQYRFNQNYDYISEICHWGKTNNNSADTNINYFSQQGNFQDIYMKIPENNTAIQYGKSYYLHLELPQHKEYTLTLNLKMGRIETGNNSVSQNNTPDLNHYQFIRELNILPSPLYLDQKISERVVLYEVPKNSSDSSNSTSTIAADVIRLKGEEERTDLESPYVCEKEQHGISYYVMNKNEDDEDIAAIEIKNKQIVRIDKTWLYGKSEDTTVSFDLVFSPKFSVSDPYNCLLLELQRQSYDNEIQYINISNGESYKGVHLNTSQISGTLYEIQNLLTTSEGVSLFGSVGTLNHIAVWSNPEFMFCINGEQIQIGQNNFYELNDFPITFFGVVVRKENGTTTNSLNDRFTVDYQYKLS